jgi:hypothetical protein
MGGRGSRRAETTAIGDWRTACWSGYQPRRAISHDEASPFPETLPIVNLLVSAKDSVAGPINDPHLDPHLRCSVDDFVDDFLKGNQIGAAAGQGRVDARSVALELVGVGWPKNEGGPNQPSCQVKNEYIVHSIALVE